MPIYNLLTLVSMVIIFKDHIHTHWVDKLLQYSSYRSLEAINDSTDEFIHVNPAAMHALGLA